MNSYPSDIAFTSTVKSLQAAKGSRAAYEKMERVSGWRVAVDDDLTTFLSEQDMFYFGTSNAEGQPYIQYRGGPPGFLRVLDSSTLGWAEFGGNQQYISTGNLTDNPKAFIFLMDYQNRRRVKLWGHARVVEGDEELNDTLHDAAYPGRVERAILFKIHAWDVNCPQHIHRRVPASEFEQLQQQVADLKSQLTALQQKAEPT